MMATSIKLAIHMLLLWVIRLPVDPHNVEVLRAFAPTHLPTTPLASVHRQDERQVRAAQIRANAHDLHDVDSALVDPAVDAALATETLAVPAELLLSIAWSESRFRPDQRTGVVCGALQVNPTDIGEPRGNCAHWASDTRLGFAAGVRELEIMLGDRRVHGNLRLALLYRACGNVAFDGTCTKTKWPQWVLARADMIRGPRTIPAPKPKKDSPTHPSILGGLRS